MKINLTIDELAVPGPPVDEEDLRLEIERELARMVARGPQAGAGEAEEDAGDSPAYRIARRIYQATDGLGARAGGRTVLESPQV